MDQSMDSSTHPSIHGSIHASLFIHRSILSFVTTVINFSAL